MNAHLMCLLYYCLEDYEVVRLMFSVLLLRSSDCSLDSSRTQDLFFSIFSPAVYWSWKTLLFVEPIPSFLDQLFHGINIRSHKVNAIAPLYYFQIIDLCLVFKFQDYLS